MPGRYRRIDLLLGRHIDQCRVDSDRDQSVGPTTDQVGDNERRRRRSLSSRLRYVSSNIRSRSRFRNSPPMTLCQGLWQLGLSLHSEADQTEHTGKAHVTRRSTMPQSCKTGHTTQHNANEYIWATKRRNIGCCTIHLCGRSGGRH